MQQNALSRRGSKMACTLPRPQACAGQSALPAPGMLCQVGAGCSADAGVDNDDLHLRAGPRSQAHMVQAVARLRRIPPRLSDTPVSHSGIMLRGELTCYPSIHRKVSPILQSEGLVPLQAASPKDTSRQPHAAD